MQEPAPFGISLDGALLICGDGPELLVYHSNGEPHWKVFCEGLLVGVGAVGDAVVAVDVDGRITWWRTLDGRSLDGSEVEGGARQLALAPERAAVLTGEGVAVLGRGGVPVVIRDRDASAISFGPDANSLGIGTAKGTFRAVEPATGTAWGEVVLGAPVTGVAWSTRGFWVVTSGHALCIVSGDGTEVLARVDDQEGPLSAPTTSADGILAAAVIGHSQIAVYELHTHRRVGNIDFRRRIGGISFGAGGQLGIGLDDGDASVVDLHAGGSLRTEPHPGRGRNNWNLENKVDSAAVRGAMAMSKAGGAAIAAYTGWRPEDDKEEEGWLRTCMGAGCGCATLLFGCVGFGVLLYVLRSWGYF